MRETLRRHTLVWLSVDGDWRAQSPALAVRLRAWFAQGHPAIVARRPHDAPAGTLHLGVPLPPDEGKQRLALTVDASAVLRSAPLPLLASVVQTAPGDWKSALLALARTAQQTRISPRVFGALAWQSLTGLPYVHARSDVDLLWEIDDLAQADAICNCLAQWESDFSMRADGELRLPDGMAISWREYASGAARLLVKTDDDARLVLRQALAGAAQVAA